MSATAYMRIARKNGVTIVASAAVGLALATASVEGRPSLYRASSQMFVSAAGASDPAQLSTGAGFVQERMKSYVLVVTSETVMQSVIKQLHLTYTAEQLRGRISANAPLDTVLINVDVTDSSPSRARDIADAITLPFAKYLQDLEATTGGAASRVTVIATRRPILPSGPVSPHRVTDIALGLILGLAVGVAFSAGQDYRANRIRRREALGQHSASLPVLGVLAATDLPSEPAIPDGKADRAPAEAAHLLGEQVRMRTAGTGAQSLLVAGYSRGEGVTTTAVSLAMGLASTGSSVVLVDANLRQPRLAPWLRVEPAPGLTDVLEGSSSALHAMRPWPGIQTLQVITAGTSSTHLSAVRNATTMGDLITSLSRQFAFIVIDSPALSESADASIIAALTDAALIVVRVNATRPDQLDSARRVLSSADATVLGLILNRVREEGPHLARTAVSTELTAHRLRRPRPEPSPDLSDGATSEA